jgi:hypothetical protein
MLLNISINTNGNIPCYNMEFVDQMQENKRLNHPFMDKYAYIF